MVAYSERNAVSPHYRQGHERAAKLILPCQEEIRDGAEGVGGFTEGGELFVGVGDEVGGVLARLVEAEDGGEGGLFVFLVGADALAHDLLGARRVENIVDDLKRDTEVQAVAGEAFEFGRRGIAGHCAEADRRGDEGGGFVPVSGFDFLKAGLALLVFEVLYLSRDETQAAGGHGEVAYQCAYGIAFGRVAFRDHGECLGQQRVAGQHGDAFAKDFMVRGFAATQIVVVHAGQVVVDERVGMDALDRAGQGHGGRGLAADGFARGEAEDGPNAFPARKNRVAHRLVDRGRRGGFRRQKLVERRIHAHAQSIQILF